MDTGKDKFETIPAVNLYKGVPVVKGEKDYEPLLDKDEKDMNLHGLIDLLKGRFERVLITDINGINKDKPQLDLYKDISKKIELWVDAGSRIRDGAIDILVAGAAKVVLGTKTLLNLEELEKICELSENVIFEIDYDDGIVSPKKKIREMSPSQLIEEVKNHGIEDIIFTDLKHLSSDSHFNIDVVSTLLRSDLKVYIHGRFDIKNKIFENLNFTGLIIEVDTIL
ncbi:MAG: hypothetical protein A7315_02375 [Candidatus Altiarchaeales archaeon WOR_SM1_79]|nr:MAG: hypothetical protein A7315_02375 [Candidatus Altiarchaeales archaeon WOR_SM1_79]